MSELKPCPFCGGEARESSPESRNSKFWRITCQTCHARIGGTHRAMNREAWNTRAERTCHNIHPDVFQCSECYAIDDDWKNPPYCHGCGAKVIE